MKIITKIRRYKWQLCAAGILAVLILAGVVSILHSRETRPARAAFTPKAVRTAGAGDKTKAASKPLFCERLAGALYCQSTPSGPPGRYALPLDAAKSEMLQPSPSGEQLLAVSSMNPLTPTTDVRVSVLDANLKTLRTVNQDILHGVQAVTWAANDDYLTFIKPTDGSRGTLEVYEISSGALHSVGADTYPLGMPYIQAGNGSIGMITADPGKPPAMISIDRTGGSAHQVNIDALSKVMKTYTKALYDHTSNNWYIAGISPDNMPVLVVATLQHDVLTIKKTQKNGNVISLLSTGPLGVAASYISAGNTQIGLLDPEGTFKQWQTNSPSGVLFSASLSPSIKPTDPQPQADDYLYDYTGLNDSQTHTFLQDLVAKDCAPGTFNQIDLLAHKDARQLVADETACGQAVPVRHYYTMQNGMYKEVLTSAGSVQCSAISGLGIDRSLAPDCIIDEVPDLPDDKQPGMLSNPGAGVTSVPGTSPQAQSQPSL